MPSTTVSWIRRKHPDREHTLAIPPIASDIRRRMNARARTHAHEHAGPHNSTTELNPTIFETRIGSTNSDFSIFHFENDAVVLIENYFRTLAAGISRLIGCCPRAASERERERGHNNVVSELSSLRSRSFLRKARAFGDVLSQTSRSSLLHEHFPPIRHSSWMKTSGL